MAARASSGMWRDIRGKGGGWEGAGRGVRHREMGEGVCNSGNIVEWRARAGREEFREVGVL